MRRRTVDWEVSQASGRRPPPAHCFAALPAMGDEDFFLMLNAPPGAFIFTGNGDSPGLHNPAYDFNDEAILYGASYWVRLAERLMARG